MGERNGSQRRIADRRRIEVADRVVANVDREFGRQLHKEVMRMLAID